MFDEVAENLHVTAVKVLDLAIRVQCRGCGAEASRRFSEVGASERVSRVRP
jgi:hypothetical protein